MRKSTQASPKRVIRVAYRVIKKPRARNVD
jgi:hypothetical protein